MTTANDFLIDTRAARFTNDAYERSYLAYAHDKNVWYGVVASLFFMGLFAAGWIADYTARVSLLPWEHATRLATVVTCLATALLLLRKPDRKGSNLILSTMLILVGAYYVTLASFSDRISNADQLFAMLILITSSFLLLSWDIRHRYLIAVILLCEGVFLVFQDRPGELDVVLVSGLFWLFCIVVAAEASRRLELRRRQTYANLLHLEAEIERRTLAEHDLREAQEAVARLLEEKSERLDEATQRLAQVQKLELIGRLTGGIAHHFNNTLMTILGFVDLSRGHGDIKQIEENLDVIENAGREASRMVNTLLAMGGQQSLNLRIQNAGRLVEEVVARGEAILMQDVGIELDVNSPGISIDVDNDVFEQMMLAMLHNAKEASESSPNVRVSVDTRTLEATLSDENPYATDFCVIGIEDSGHGIEPENLKKIFEPFYSTKPEGMSSGLGLAVALGIAEQMGGTIQVQSTPGEGSLFEILLPLAS